MTTVIKSSRVRVGAPADSDSRGAPVARRAPGRALCTKQVRPLELEGRLHALEIRCSCGEITTVELDYAPNSEGEAT